MAVKTYGIFLAYPPNVNLHAEGLGRYLAAFVKGATRSGDFDLVIAAPSWFRRHLRELFKEHGIPESAIRFVGPEIQPLLLTLVQWAARTGHRIEGRGIEKWRRLEWIGRIRPALGNHVQRLVYLMVGARDPVSLVAVGLYILFLALLASPVALAVFVYRIGKRLVNKIQSLKSQIAKRSRIGRLLLSQPIGRFLPELNRIPRLFYNRMLEREVEIMVDKANKIAPIAAWYSPTSLWPNFNRLRAPRLACFPDLVLLEFPVGFGLHGTLVKNIAAQVKEAVKGGQHFVTYSEHIKRSVMMQALGVQSHQVEVVHHAPSTLKARIQIQGFENNDIATESFCRALAKESLSKATGLTIGQRFDEVKFDFLFYASQFRPSKNITSLLRAYEYLLRRRYIGHKLILTGHGENVPVMNFIREHRLERDVLCLHGLSEAQLAAFYRLADLAVNPTLSEGGMPFTFTEALSVGTPVVMSDIEVTREIITDPDLRAATLFDPYDWRAIAEKIEWALANKTSLYALQRKFYDDVLSKRTWEDVVSDHIAILDRIAEEASPPC